MSVTGDIAGYQTPYAFSGGRKKDKKKRKKNATNSTGYEIVREAIESSDIPQISKLIGTTKETIGKIRNRTHWNINNIQAKHPAILGLCSQNDLNVAIEKSGGKLKSPSEQLSDTNEIP